MPAPVLSPINPHDPSFLKQRMLTGAECMACQSILIVGIITWITKLRDLYKKGTAIKLDPRAVILTIVLDLLLAVILKVLESALSSECVKKKLLGHAGPDIRRTRGGCRHRVRKKMPFVPFVGGGGQSGGGGASGTWELEERFAPQREPAFGLLIPDFNSDVEPNLEQQLDTKTPQPPP